MNNFGRIFRLSIFGESHGPAVGISISGVPAGIPLAVADFEADMSRRRSGAKGTTPRTEPDKPVLLSGVFNDKTTGAPLTIIFENTNTRSKDYSNLLKSPRPGHADFTARKKYGGFNDYTGGGHFSGRLTAAIVAAGVVAKKVIDPIRVSAHVAEAGGQTDINAAIDAALAAGDSIGGLIKCEARNMPVGLGEPFFDKAEALIAHAIFALPAVKGVEFGAGFQAARMKGSEHNDNIVDMKGHTETNNAGGLNGGLTNGNMLDIKVAVKPTSSISKPQKTLNTEKGSVDTLEVKGRHDACIALRVPPIVEASVSIVLADLLLIDQQRPRVAPRS